MRSYFMLHRDVSAVLVLVLTAAKAGSLPYNPASFLISPVNPSIAYLLGPVSSTSQQFQISRLDLSKPITSTDASYVTIQGKLPFLDDARSVAFVAVIDGDGIITALAGDCSQSASLSRVWRLDTGGSSGKVASAWTQLTPNSNSKMIAEYMSSAISFPSSLTSTANDYKTYVFGGMCPYNNATRATWTSSAAYYSTLNKFGLATNQLDIGAVVTRNSPVAQAGHSLTALTPTFSNRSDGSQTSQQNFLLLGGHTNSAFLNLSQAALFSLPQETWTYLPITSASDKTDVSSIEPRSGHTATLSSDGKQIVVFGGWIGDISTPASPQIVVLNVADGYGGIGGWAWSAPSAKNQAVQPSGGLYGHAAVMLPGNVLLVTGGYSMASSSGASKRDVSSLQMNTKTYMYNITANTWLTTYNAPPTINAQAKSGSTSGQKVGIGIGVTLAIVAIVAMIVGLVWYKRRSNRRRKQVEDDLRSTKEGYVGEDWDVERTDDDDRFYRHFGLPRMVPPPAALNRGRSRHANGNRTILTGDNSNQLSGPKRNTAGGRGPYPYERSRNRDAIHPIMEGNEDSSENLARQDKALDAGYVVNDGSDPFSDPRSNHQTHARPRAGSSVSSCHEQELEIENWSTQWAKAGSQLMRGNDDHSPTSEMGRTSPTKSDHTVASTSSISPRTSYATPVAGGPVSIVRSLSYRSATLLSSLANPFSNGHAHNNSSSTSPPSSVVVSKSIYSKKGPSKQDPHQVDFARVQAESKTMLETRSSQGSRRPSYEQDNASPVHRTSNATNSWVGSVRRVIGMSSAYSAYPRSTSLTNDSTKARTTALRQHGSGAEPMMSTAVVASGALLTANSAGTVVPRRSASDAAFWKSRRGAKDWASGSSSSGAGAGGANETQNGNTNDDDDEEWDVETAAQDRVVQLMFTVPRERLRVVNADVAVDGRSIVSMEEVAPAVPAKDVVIVSKGDNWERL